MHWTDADINATAWLLGWRVANEGLVLERQDEEFMELFPHYRAGLRYRDGTRGEAEQLATAMGEVPEEEL